jgi:DNA-binding NtrC family response regulator
MYRPPPLRGRPVLTGKKVLLIDRCQATREARAAVLRSHDVEVHEAEDISSARFLWQPHVYDLVMLDVRRYSSEETREFYEQIRAADPRQQIVFLVGPPSYLSSAWPAEVAVDDVSRGQWAETVKRFMAALRLSPENLRWGCSERRQPEGGPYGSGSLYNPPG